MCPICRETDWRLSPRTEPCADSAIGLYECLLPSAHRLGLTCRPGSGAAIAAQVRAYGGALPWFPTAPTPAFLLPRSRRRPGARRHARWRASSGHPCGPGFARCRSWMPPHVREGSGSRMDGPGVLAEGRGCPRACCPLQRPPNRRRHQHQDAEAWLSTPQSKRPQLAQPLRHGLTPSWGARRWSNGLRWISSPEVRKAFEAYAEGEGRGMVDLLRDWSEGRIGVPAALEDVRR